MGMALELKQVVETNLIRVRYHCISCYLHFNIPFKNRYTQATKCIEHFSYKGRCSVRVGLHISRHLKEELDSIVVIEQKVDSKAFAIPILTARL